MSPDDALDRLVRPAGWQNPPSQGTYDFVVIGAGTAGLVSAVGAAGLGARVALVERERLARSVSFVARARWGFESPASTSISRPSCAACGNAGRPWR
jgi:glycine/D-amino acid oxidase-like deaminating enzyme